ncbi:acyl-CoA thioesterase [Glutamicibacter uratoxydans]|uniref:acyl-CoA thioesterase n=1 Tax=Glutamicibacter uratoxydans TaxID=43667 RepID=UPI003D6DE861
MHMIFRLIALLLSARKRPRISMLDAGTLPMRATLTDIDFAGHINNGMYFSIFDLGRFDLMFRSGVFRTIRKNGWTPVVQAETITFRKSVKFGTRFTQETLLLGADEKCIYFEQRIVVKGEIYARGYIATRMVSAKGPVPNEQIFAAAGVSLPLERELPQWLTRWREETALPGSRKPAPHRWIG